MHSDVVISGNPVRREPQILRKPSGTSFSQSWGLQCRSQALQRGAHGMTSAGCASQPLSLLSA